MSPRKLVTIISSCLMLFAAACSAPQVDTGPTKSLKIAELAQSIRALGPDVDPEEAARAALIAYEYTSQLAREYEITDPPLIHNTKVNMGLRPRGLCWHWAEDMEARLDSENFQTLEMHRAIANADSAILIDHSTAIISAKGDGMFDGIVLDPWRKGGVLFWSPTLEDTRYEWHPREVVLAERTRRMIENGELVLPAG